MKSITRILYVLLTLFGFYFLEGCEKISSVNDGRIKVIVSTNDTKSTSVNITTEIIREFTINGASSEELFEETATKSAEIWSINNEPHWINAIPMYFWCWSPCSVKTSGAMTPLSYQNSTDAPQMTFQYTLPSGESQTDLVFAHTWEQRSYDTSGNLSSWNGSFGGRGDEYMNINFFHALSDIRFAINPSFSEEYRIKYIKLENIASSGECTFNPKAVSSAAKFEWSFDNPTPTGNYTQNIPDPYWDKDSDASAVHFYVIPHTLSGSTAITIGVIADGGGDVEEKTATIKDPDDVETHVWLPGKYYKYRLNIPSGPEISFSISLEAWGDTEDKIIEGTLSPLS